MLLLVVVVVVLVRAGTIVNFKKRWRGIRCAVKTNNAGGG